MIRELLEFLGAYKVYEAWLKRQLKGGAKVEHIAIIADENLNVNGDRGDSFSSKMVDILEWCLEIDVKYVTIYALSIEALKTPRWRVEEALRVLEEGLKTLLKNDVLYKYEVRVKAIGKLNLLPERIRALISLLEENTKTYDEHFLNLAVAYKGRLEIVDATRKLAEDVRSGKLNPDSIDDLTLEKYLYTSHIPKQDPDLIIRTSGDERLSGFLLWQSAYSELCFLDVDWSHLRKIDILRAVRTFKKRKRRFGR
ncbi:di-trans,poly-cis-decaprenylcistransferase [Candidatus Bathyarchaeota archaeon]|nr:MAG: di-trans,poly-cis-decaprenylcistransferase [Candidatus Bathyarchaeota archaeon]